MNRSQVEKVFSAFYDNADPRLRDWPLMGSPVPIISIYLIYVLVILKILPKFMENRKPLDYKKFMLIVDMILCARSSYFTYLGIEAWFFYAYSWRCQPKFTDPNIAQSHKEVLNCYLFVVTKFLYTLQSVVFVMCKKQSSVSTYLLIHHATFPLLLWIGTNFYPGGHATFIGSINAVVHFCVTGMRIISTIWPSESFIKYSKIVDVRMHVSFFKAIEY